MFEFEERFLPVTETTGGGPTNSTMLRSVAALDIVQADGAFIIGYPTFIISCWRNCLILDRWLVERRFRILTRLSLNIDESEHSIVRLCIQLGWLNRLNYRRGFLANDRLVRRIEELSERRLFHQCRLGVVQRFTDTVWH